MDSKRPGAYVPGLFLCSNSTGCGILPAGIDNDLFAATLSSQNRIRSNSMTNTSVSHTLSTLDTIIKACEEIQSVLHKQIEKATNPTYLDDFQRDIVTLDNLKLIIVTVSEDFRNETVGSSTELLLRIAANDFKQKLAVIPEKKTLRKEIEQLLKDVHKDVVKFKVTTQKGV
jgi:hypothetical protein